MFGLYLIYIPLARSTLFSKMRSNREQKLLAAASILEKKKSDSLKGVLPTKSTKHTLSKFRHEKSRYFLR